MTSLINQRYKFVRSLGEGGMGTVVLVEDILQNKRQLALKTMHADQVGARNITQFKYEFMALAQLRHPNVVQAYDFGYAEATKMYFFTMEYVAGEDWATVARHRAAAGTLDFEWLYDVFVHVGWVLQYIHARGFIHYDIKPSNVRLTPAGQVKLIDFGLIGPPQGSGEFQTRGTPEYIAPEVAHGVAVDQRADLYSLGISLYEIVMGQLPTPTMLAADDLAAALTDVLKTAAFALPECWGTFMAQLLARAPKARYGSANETIMALNTLLADSHTLTSYAKVQSYIQGGAVVGRRFELARLQGALLRTLQGHGRLVLLAGPAGVGKSRLARELRLHAQLQRVLVCEGVCDEYVRTPYRPWVSIFKQIFVQSPPECRTQLQRYRGAFVDLMPDLADVVNTELGRQRSDVHTPEEKRHMLRAVIEGVLTFDHPLLLILDDLQYADAETLELLDVLGQQAQRGKVLLLGLYRDAEVDEMHPLQRVAARARVISRRERVSSSHDGYLHELLRLDLLTEDAVADWVKLMLGIGLTEDVALPAGLLPWLMTETGGNPLFIESVMRTLVEDRVLHYADAGWRLDRDGISRMPSSIRETAQRRLARLDPASLHILQWASVIGQWLDFELLADVSTVTLAEVVDVVRWGTRHYVLASSERAAKSDYRFSNDQMRLVIYNTLTPEEQAQRHAVCAEALCRHYAEQDVVALLAWHYEQAWLLDRALHYAALAGDRAQNVYAQRSAVGYYTQALNFADTLGPTIVSSETRYTLLSRRAAAYEHLGQHRERAGDLAEMAQIAAAMGNAAHQIEVMIRRVAVMELLGDHRDAIQTGETALTLARKFDDAVLIIDSLDVLGEAYYRIGNIEAAYTAHQEALTRCGELKDRQREAHLLWHMGTLARLREGVAVARGYMQQSLELQRALGNQAGVADALNELAIQSSDFAQQRYYHEQVLEIARATGDRNRQMRAFNNLALTYWGLGLYPRAREYSEQAVQMAREIFSRSRLTMLLESLGRIYFDLEDYLPAQRVFEEGLALTQEIGDAYSESMYFYGMAHVKLVEGDLPAARDLFMRACDMQKERQMLAVLFSSQAGLALTYLGLGDWDQANTYILAALETLKAIGGKGEFLSQEVWWIRYQVLQAAPAEIVAGAASAAAGEALRQAYTVMMAGIATLTDEGLRRNYLNKVRVNRDIIAEWTRHVAKQRPGTDTGALKVEHALTAVEVERDAVAESEQLRARLKRVLDISVRMNEIHNAEALLNYVMEQVIELSGAARGVLLLLGADRQMEYRVARGFDLQELAQEQAEISYSVLGSVAQSRQPVLLQDALTDERFGTQDSVLELNLRSVLCVPLIARADLIGMIYADNRSVSGRFLQSDLSLMMLFANQAAAAIENANLYGKLHAANAELADWAHTLEARVDERTAEVEAASIVLSQRAVQLETSRQVAQQITSILELDALLERVVSLIQAQFHYYFVGVWMADVAQQVLTLRAGTDNMARRLHDRGLRLPLDAPSVNASVYRAGEMRVVQNVAETTDFIRVQDLPYLASEFVLPLRAGEQVLGTLNIGCEHPAGFSDDDMGMLSGLADQIAVAIRNAQLYAAEQRRRELTELLEQAGRELTRSLDMREVPARILALVKTLVPYERGMVMLQEGAELKPVAHHGFVDARRAEAIRMSICEGDVYQQLEQARRPLIINDTLQEVGWTQVSWLPVNRSWLGVALIAKGSAIGMISLTRREANGFTEEDATWVQAFAAQASVAVQNAAYHDQIVRFNEQLEQRVQQRTLELDAANRVLEQLDKTKSDFIKIAAHELNTPLTVISSYAQMSQHSVSHQSSPNLEKYLQGIVAGSNRMHDVVNSMLNVARINSQTLQLFREATSLVALMRRVHDEFVEVLKQRKLTLTLTSLADLPLLHGDAELLQKAFHHLIVNAIKYTPDGGEISVSGREVTLPHNVAGVEVVVADTGIGINATDLDLIFETFYQIEPVEYHSSGDTAFKAGGPGLGLTIARGIILAHGGQIWAESEGCNEERCLGSQFYVRLPVGSGE